MSVIPDELIEQVRDAADIVEILGEFVELKRTGADYRGACPFHSGKDRNFAVIPKKQMYYCFVCHEGGDVFTYFMKQHGLEYPVAVREVARRVGISIPDRPSAGPDPREPLFTAVSVAADWYSRRLRESKDATIAREYLAKRGFDGDKLQMLGLGYSPRGDEFLEAMDTLGIKRTDLAEAGLMVTREDGSERPRFWNRLLFPIADLRGRVVGFGGRVLGDGEPKYLNSPESQIFHKGRMLYNLHNAKQAIRKAERAVVVEGYFDVLRLYDVGIEEVVAPLGTSFTSDQATLLKRSCKDVVLLYDSDQAGLKATFRAADELLRAGLSVSVATLPPGEDPDSLAVSGGGKAINQLLDDAIDVFERKLQLLERKGWFGSLSGRRKALDRLTPSIRAAADPVIKDLYMSRAAEALGVSLESVKRESTGRSYRSPRRQNAPRNTDPTPVRAKDAVPERELVRVMIHKSEWRTRIGEALPNGVELFEPEGSLLRLLIESDETTAPSDLMLQVEGPARNLLREALDQGLGEENIDAIVSGALNRLEGRLLTKKISEIEYRLPVADEAEKLKLLQEKAELSQKRREINNTYDWNLIRRGGKRGAG